MVFVKWKGYAKPTWESLQEHLDSAALDDFEAAYGDAEKNNGPLSAFEPGASEEEGGNVTGQARVGTEARPRRKKRRKRSGAEEEV